MIEYDFELFLNKKVSFSPFEPFFSFFPLLFCFYDIKMDPNNPYSQQYPPPPQQFAQPPQGYNYNAQQPPQYYPPPPPPSNQPHQHVPQYNTNTGYAELGEAPLNANDKIRPSSGYKDVWATVLWLCNMAAFIALSVIGLRSFSLNNGTGSTTPQSGLAFDSDTVKIFGLAAVVGFGFSFIYLIMANL